MSSERWRRLAGAPGLLPTLLVLVLLLALRIYNPAPVELARMRGFDLAQQASPRVFDPARGVRIVAIDERSLAEQGQWPWPRTDIARLIDRIAEAGPAVLAIDLLFVEPDRLAPDGDTALAAALKRVPTVLGLGISHDAAPQGDKLRRITLVSTGGDPKPFLLSYPAIIASRPALREAERGRGVLAGLADADGILRRPPLFVLAEDKILPSLSVEAVRVTTRAGLSLHADAGGISHARFTGGTRATVDLPIDSRGRAYPHFSRSVKGRYLSATDIMGGRTDPAQLRNTILLLGVTGLGLIDLKLTPLGPMEGIEVHAQMIESMLARELLLRPTSIERVEPLLALAVGLAMIALPYRRPRMAVAGLGAAVLMLLGGELAALRFGGLLIDGAYPVLCAVAAFGVRLGASLRAAEAARRALAEQLQREREAKARLEGELGMARKIQMGLLPRQFPGPPARGDVDSYALIEPARSVGGDLYDLLLLDERRLFFMIADVSGKGVPAALFMAMSKEVLRTAALRHGEELDLAFAEANAKISAASTDMAGEGADMMFVTVCAGVLDLDTGGLVHASAGHDAPIVLGPGGGREALESAGGPPLGAMDEFPYGVEWRQLKPGETVLLYTDGVTDAEDPSRNFYTLARLHAALDRAPRETPSATIEFLRAELRGFVASADPADDITLLAVRWPGPIC